MSRFWKTLEGNMELLKDSKLGNEYLVCICFQKIILAVAWRVVGNEAKLEAENLLATALVLGK